MNRTDLIRLETSGVWTEHRPGIDAQIGQAATVFDPTIRCTAIIQQPGVTALRWHRFPDGAA